MYTYSIPKRGNIINWKGFGAKRGSRHMKKSYDAAIEAAVDFVTYRERTEAEVREKLRSYDFSETEIDEAVQELKDALLLNDEQYAQDYVQSRLAQRPVSKRTLRTKLKKHKIDEFLIDETIMQLPDTSDYDNAYVEAYSYLLNNLPRTDNIKKLYARLLRRLISHGYPYDDARSAIQRAQRDIENPDLL